MLDSVLAFLSSGRFCLLYNKNDFVVLCPHWTSYIGYENKHRQKYYLAACGEIKFCLSDILIANIAVCRVYLHTYRDAICGIAIELHHFVLCM